MSDTTSASAFVAHPVNRAATLSGLSRSRLYEYMAQGELPYSKLGRRRLIADGDLRRLIEHHRVGGPVAEK